jgi:hypothetical protein
MALFEEGRIEGQNTVPQVVASMVVAGAIAVF